MILPEQNLRVLASKTRWILDGDGLVYLLDSKFGQNLYQKIADNFNVMVQDDEMLAEKYLGSLGDIKDKLQNPMQLSATDLGIAYVPIIRALIEHDKKDVPLGVTLDQLYGRGHEEGIEKDPAFVEALALARSKGIEIMMVTNGPSGKRKGIDLHTQFMLKAIGCDDETIEYLRDQTLDIVSAVEVELQKHEDGFYHQVFFPRLDFIPNLRPEECLMVDDGVKNIAAAHAVGIAPLWAWTNSEKDPKPADVKWAEKIGAPRISRPGEVLLEIAEAHTPINS